MIQPEAAIRPLERACIVVLMDNRSNADLLRRELAMTYDVMVGMPPDADEYRNADLILVDGISLHRYAPILVRARETQNPLYLPVVLLTERDDINLRSAQLRSIVDDVLKRPLAKAELHTRVESLLRARSLSRQVVRMQGLYETERAVAQRFQEAALPKHLPCIEGIGLSAHYSAGHREVQVGGDWYDALALEDGRLVLSIGDVCGAGLEAAVTMAHVRQVIRGVAHIHPDPTMMLDAVNRNLHAEYPGRMVTALVAVLDPITSVLTYANAGHVPPLLRTETGEIVELRVGELPLGVTMEPPARHTAEMPPGSALLLYTDGLTEYTREPVEGQQRLEAILRSGELLNEADGAGAVFRALIGDEPPDDVAILLVQRDPNGTKGESWIFRSDDAEMFGIVRTAICQALKNHGFVDDQCMVAEMIFAELVGNVVRYAPGIIEVILERTAGLPTLHVLDRGPSFSYAPRLPSNLLAENGRGLYLVKELSREFNVSIRHGGGSHARVVFK